MRTTILRLSRCIGSLRLTAAAFARGRALPVISAALLVAALAGLGPASAFAQVTHYSDPGGGVDDSNGQFQLEGNTSTDSFICFGLTSSGPTIATPGAGNTCPSGTEIVQFGSQTDDWDLIYAGSGDHAIATTGIINDDFNTHADNTLTGGSTKDPSDFADWKWKSAKTGQSKDDIENAYAAAYVRSSDHHLIIYAGMDRWDNSGNSTAGFWFVQDPNVGSGTVNSDGTPATCSAGSGCAFGGQHTNGDLLIISQFNVGGADSTIVAYVWEDGALAGPYMTVGTGANTLSAGQCDPTKGNLGICGTVNGVPVLSGGWAFTAKHPAGCNANGTGLGTTMTNCMDKGEFLEIGVDVTGLFQAIDEQQPCISKFFAETRASTSKASTLSDFVVPSSLPVCSISATKICNATLGSTINSTGTAITYNFNGQIKNTSASSATLSFPATGAVTDTPVPGPLGECRPAVISGPCTSLDKDTGTCDANTFQCAGLAAPGDTGDTCYYSGSLACNFISPTFDNKATATVETPEGGTLTSTGSWLRGGVNNCAPTVGMLKLVPKCATEIGSGNPLTIQIDFGGVLTNDSGVEVQNITITDTNVSDPSSISVVCKAANNCSGSGNGTFTLYPNGTASYRGSYDSDTCSPTTLGGRCTFADSVSASGTGALGTGTINSGAMPTGTTCPLCPSGSCE